MLHFVLPESRQRALVFYLAMEEFIPQVLKECANLSEGESEAFFIWQVPPTVIFGRNQVMEAEVNIEYCKAKDIKLFRRKSGGGCVYADMGNIMVSYITTSTDVTSTFDRFLKKLSQIFKNIGLNAECSGRNDILINGKKVSGNAFFHKNDISIVHGTMLFDSDFDELTKAITPSEAKIRSKGVDSVRQHVTNIKAELERTDTPLAKELREIEKFKAYVVRELQGDDREITLTKEQVKEIELIETSYLDPDFLSGRRHGYSIQRSGRIEGVGQICISIDVEADKVVSASLSGDYFTVKEGFETELNRRLSECLITEGAIRDAFSGLNTEDYAMNLRNEDLIRIILGNSNS